MRLGINGWRIHGDRTGVGRYLLNLVRHWDKQMTADRFEEVVFYSQKEVDRSRIPIPQNIRERVLPPEMTMLAWENLRFGPVATEDVLFCPSYSRPLITRGKTVVAIFEATLKLYPEHFPRSHWYSFPQFYLNVYQLSGRNSSLVLTSSQAAKDDIVRAYGIPEEKIRVVYLAAGEEFQQCGTLSQHSEIRHRYLGTDDPFFLYVGKMTPRRNVPMLLEAFQRFKRDTGLPHKLLVVGKNITHFDIHSIARDLGIEKDFAHAEFVPDSDLILLYSAAHAFVLPYSYEAVSLTVVEAQRTGLPVITMDTPGLREISGDAAFYLEYCDVSDLTIALREIATDDNLHRDLSLRGLESAHRFSWRRTADETLDVLREAGNGPQ